MQLTDALVYLKISFWKQLAGPCAWFYWSVVRRCPSGSGSEQKGQLAWWWRPLVSLWDILRGSAVAAQASLSHACGEAAKM